MSSGTFIIQSALKKIGGHSIAQAALPETIEDGANILNSWLQMQLSQGVDLGIIPLEEPGEELGEPLDSTNAIIDNLALELSPDFDNGENIVSPRLRANAAIGLAFLKRKYQKSKIPEKVVSSTLPLGAGGRTGFRRRRYKPIGGTVGG
jgi:hypothetical protein